MLEPLSFHQLGFGLCLSDLLSLFDLCLDLLHILAFLVLTGLGNAHPFFLLLVGPEDSRLLPQRDLLEERVHFLLCDLALDILELVSLPLEKLAVLQVLFI